MEPRVGASPGIRVFPYPETTGMALAALRGDRSPGTERGLTVAPALPGGVPLGGTP